MFARIRKRLTFLYTAMLALFLVTFVAVSYFGLKWAINNEEEQEVHMLAREEAEEHRDMLKRGPGSEEEPVQDANNNDRDLGGLMFYYVMNSTGQQVAEEEPAPVLRSPILEKIRSGAIKNGDLLLETFPLHDGKEATLMLTARDIYDGPQLLGTIYLGKYLTSYYQVLERLLVILVAILVISLILASGAGYLLAGRAMVPIKQSFSRQREFAADASHELRTPLSVLLASVEVIQGDDMNNISSFSQQVLHDMKDEMRKMSNIVHHLLTLARADAGVIDLLKEKFDLKSVAEQVVRNLQPLANEKKVALKFATSGVLPVYADKERLSQLLLILIDNGVKYTPSGGSVTVQIERAQDTNALKIVVKDTGIGIEEKYLKRIFERFYRVDKMQSREVGGSGLGLSIAQWIVKTHGGTIRVDSSPERGSTFAVVLPI